MQAVVATLEFNEYLNKDESSIILDIGFEGTQIGHLVGTDCRADELAQYGLRKIIGKNIK